MRAAWLYSLALSYLVATPASGATISVPFPEELLGTFASDGEDPSATLRLGTAFVEITDVRVQLIGFVLPGTAACFPLGMPPSDCGEDDSYHPEILLALDSADIFNIPRTVFFTDDVPVGGADFATDEQPLTASSATPADFGFMLAGDVVLGIGIGGGLSLPSGATFSGPFPRPGFPLGCSSLLFCSVAVPSQVTLSGGFLIVEGTPVPEPSAALPLLLGLVALATRSSGSMPSPD